MPMKGAHYALFCYVDVLFLLLGYTFCGEEVHVILPLSSSIVFPDWVPSDYFPKRHQAVFYHCGMNRVEEYKNHAGCVLPVMQEVRT